MKKRVKLKSLLALLLVVLMSSGLLSSANGGGYVFNGVIEYGTPVKITPSIDYPPTDVKTGMITLVGVESDESYDTYCIDLMTRLNQDILYTKIFLEDVTTLSDSQAESIRAIIAGGYNDKSQSTEDLRIRVGLASLSKEDAIGATQLAIWVVTNNALRSDDTYSPELLATTNYLLSLSGVAKPTTAIITIHDMTFNVNLAENKIDFMYSFTSDKDPADIMLDSRVDLGGATLAQSLESASGVYTGSFSFPIVDYLALADKTINISVFGQHMLRDTFAFETYESESFSQATVATRLSPVPYEVGAEKSFAFESTLTVRHFTDTGTEFAPTTTGPIALGAPYTTSAVAFNSALYTVAVPGNATGVSLGQPITVTYIYTPVPPPPIYGSVVVRHQNLAGQTLAPSTSTSGLEGASYTTAPVTLPGYALTGTPANATGNYIDGTITVTYIYAPAQLPAQGTLIVRHISTDGTPLSPTLTSMAPVGTNYTTSPVTIADYNLVETPANATGVYTNGVIIAIYVYAPQVETTTEPEAVTEEITDETVALGAAIPVATLPQTGQSSPLAFTLIGALLFLVGLIIRRK